MFNGRKYDMERLMSIKPTSKASLKMQCLAASEGDIERAEKLYSFMIEGMDELPMFDSIPPTTMQQISDNAKKVAGWVSENRNDIMEWVGFFRSLFSKGADPTAIPGNPFPPINQ